MPVPAGFVAAGVTCGLKPSGRSDLALVLSEHPCTFAALFTQNSCAAPPVERGRELLAHSPYLLGLVVNSGNANAATGEQGLRAATRMAELAAGAWSLRFGRAAEASAFLSSSTGVIGRQLPMDKVDAGINAATKALGGDPAHWHDASRAIMTTDTHPKMAHRTIEVPGGGRVQLLGMCKGAGMIHPNMATMLAYFFTDAAIDTSHLRAVFHTAIHHSFNAISIDGDTSTNDTALIMANGASNVKLAPGAEGWHDFVEALGDLARQLALMIVSDQEGGIRTLCRIEVSGATNEASARRLGESVATSLLFKSALHGADPNWGRIIAALGNSGIPLKLTDITVQLGPFVLIEHGTPQPFPAADASALMKNAETHLCIRVGDGPGRFTYFTANLSEDYVTFNSAYTT